MTTLENLKQTIVSKLLEKGKRWNLGAKLFPLTEHDDSKDTILEMMELLKLCGLKLNSLKTCKKCALHSESIRNIGNTKYTGRSNDEDLLFALLLYIKSVMYAPVKSKELALSYANVSLVLYKLCKFEECLQAIDYCLSLDYPKNLKIKVLIRRTQCLIALNSPEAKKSYKETLLWIKKEVRSDEQDKYLIIVKKLLVRGDVKSESKPARNICDVIFNEFSDKTKNSEIPALSGAVSLKYNNTYGRHLVATRDIRPGEIIGKEIPYCLLFKSEYISCWNCSKIIFFPIACDHCATVIYCSMKCKFKSWETCHSIECNILPHLKNIAVDHSEPLINVLRITILAVKEFGEVGKLLDELKRVDEWKDPRTRGFSDNQKFQSNKFCSVYSICEKHKEENWQMKYLFTAIIVYHLATKSNIFGKMFRENWNVIQQNEEIVTFAKMVVKIFKIVSSTLIIKYGFSDKLATCFSILPTFSLLNHSCCPNAEIFYNFEDVHLITLCPIKKGEQIFINYLKLYFATSLPTSKRQEMLVSLCDLKCKCIACEQNWPDTIAYAPTENNDYMAQFYKKLELEITSRSLDSLSYEKSIIDNIKSIICASEKIHKFFDSPGFHSEKMKRMLIINLQFAYK